MKLSVVFDLDGTLITCENKQKFVLFSILKSIGGIDIVKLNSWWELKRSGYNTEQALTLIGYSNAKFVSEIWVKMVESFTNCSFDKPFSDSLTSLEYLKNNSINHISILTARQYPVQVYQAIYRFGFDKYIDDLIVVSPNDAVIAKQKYLKKANPLLFVGDTESDHMAAFNSNIKFVALSRGQRSNDFLCNIGIPQIESDLSFLRNTTFITSF